MAAVLCHPHPLYGRTMQNKVVFRAAKGAREQVVLTLRFSFWGVGKGTGTYDNGKGERDDVRAPLGFLHRRFPATPLCVVGFSFGAWVGLELGAEDERVAVLVGVGVPTAARDMSFLRSAFKPNLILQGTSYPWAS